MSISDAEHAAAAYRRDCEREERLMSQIKAHATDLLELCDQLRWGDGTAVGMAKYVLEDLAAVHGYDSTVAAYAARTRKRRKIRNARSVWDRDGWRCVACGTHVGLTVDHIVPVALGGSDDMTNLQTLCGRCNSRKGARV